ncbi:MAG: ABC transporter permease [Chloroflexota bacterium]
MASRETLVVEPGTGAATSIRRLRPSGRWRQFRRHRLASIGLMMLTLIVLMVTVGPLLYPHKIDDIDLLARLKPPSLAHPMGTDDLGRDLMARVLIGGRISIAVGVVSTVVAVLVGIVLGALAGYVGGLVDTVIMRVVDLFISLPQLPLLLLVVYLFREPLRQRIGTEAGVFLLMVAVIGGLRWMPIARLVRASFLSLRHTEFMMACRCLGVPAVRQVVSHLLPNALSPVVVAASLGISTAIIAESTLSFLGLGFPPDLPTWGRILADGKDKLDTAPHWPLFPGLMIVLTVLCINLIGDGLRDALDPRKSP